MEQFSENKQINFEKKENMKKDELKEEDSNKNENELSQDKGPYPPKVSYLLN